MGQEDLKKANATKAANSVRSKKINSLKADLDQGIKNLRKGELALKAREEEKMDAAVSVQAACASEAALAKALSQAEANAKRQQKKMETLLQQAKVDRAKAIEDKEDLEKKNAMLEQSSEALAKEIVILKKQLAGQAGRSSRCFG